MKKIVSIFIALIMAFSMSACGSNQGSTEPTTHESTTTEMKSTEKSTTEEKIEEPTENLEPLEVLDFGYTAYESPLTLYSFDDEKQTMIYYAVKIKNPNPEHAIDYVLINITAKNSYGKILYDYDEPLSAIAAGDTIFYGSTIIYDGETPAEVEVTVKSGRESGGYILREKSTAIYQNELVVSDVSEYKDDDGVSVTFKGNITNTSKFDIESYFPISVVFYKDNKIIGGSLDYYEGLKSGESMPFEIKISYTPEEMRDYDYYEIYVGQ